MMANAKIAQLEDLARDMVGDGQRPNLFFVTLEGSVWTITMSLRDAYASWKDVATHTRNTTLEDRLHGIVASTYQDPETRRWVIEDDVERIFRGRFVPPV